ncbi:MAG: alpha/beta hydrolase [Rhodospirillales bacterium]|nr:alpha/beta hydrolase [Rhodospirillales bacterium]
MVVLRSAPGRGLAARLAILLTAIAMLPLAGCTNMFFHPTPTHVLTPDQVGLAWRDVWFESADSVRLHGWFLPAEGEAKGTVLFMHGNAQNISTHLASVAWLPGRGYNVFLFDYRGYGSSDGVPDLDGLHRDSEAAIAETFRLEGVDANRVALFGQSLGGSLAIEALARSPEKPRVRALIVEGAFAGYRRVAREVLARSWLTWPLQTPLSLAIADDYEPGTAIATIAPIPVLIIQGEDDSIIDPAHAHDLYAAAGHPKALWLVPNAPHIAALRTPAMRDRFVSYLNACAFADAERGSACEQASALSSAAP